MLFFFFFAFSARVKSSPSSPLILITLLSFKREGATLLSAFTCFVHVIVLFWHILLGATVSEAVYSSMNRVFVKVDLA